MKYLIAIRKYKLLIISTIWIVGCQIEEKVKPPKDLLDKNTMGLILADVLLLENHLIQVTSTSDTFNFNDLQFSTPALIDEKYHLKDSQAFHSYHYYLNDPSKMKIVIEIALDTLTKLAEKSSPATLE